MRYVKAITKTTAVCIGLSTFTHFAGALEITTRGALYGEYSDNSLRTASDEISELEYNLEAGVNMQAVSNRYNGKLDYLLTSTHFDRDTFDNRNIIVGSSSLDLVISPDRFLWQFEHFQDYQRINSRLPDVPDNRDERGIIQTGPLFLFDLSPVDEISISARYVETLFQENTVGNSERTISSLHWLHRYSPIGSVTLVGSYYDVEFENREFQYDQTRVGVNFSGQLKDGNYVLETGGIKIERDNGEEIDGYYVIAELDLAFGLHSFNASYNRELTDTSLGLSLSTDFAVDIPNGDTNFDVVDILESQRFQMAYRRVGVFSNGDLGARTYWEKEDYETRTDGETRVGAVGVATYRFTDTLSTEMELVYEEVKSEDSIGVNEDKELDLSFVYTLSKSWDLRVSAIYERRDNDDEPAQDYDAFGGLVGIFYNSE